LSIIRTLIIAFAWRPLQFSASAIFSSKARATVSGVVISAKAHPIVGVEAISFCLALIKNPFQVWALIEIAGST
jgi:hypothetical protein